MRQRLIPSIVAALSSGAGLALLSALLFRASTRLAKLLLRDVDEAIAYIRTFAGQ